MSRFICSMKPMRELFNEIAEEFERKEVAIERLRKENEELRDEKYKDEELARLKRRLEDVEYELYRGFPISEEEETKIKKWKEIHEIKHKGGHGAIGGKYTYMFVPTGVGTIGEIKCTCGESFCFSDI